MSFYFAEFCAAPGVPGEHVRYDTRVYLNGGARVQSGGTSVAAVVGKNPGSAAPGVALGSWGPLVLGRDKLLPNVRSIFEKAYDLATRTRGIPPPPEDAYIQVLNLSYFCSADLSALIPHLRAGMIFHPCPQETPTFPLLWYLWGGPHRDLTPLKGRFAARREPKQFYYDQAAKTVAAVAASPGASARHTQGMVHGWVVPHLANLL